VGPRRQDGFHPLDSYAVKVTLYDRIDLLARRDGHLHLHCTGADCGRTDDNLALRAARLLRQHCLANMPASAGGMDCLGADIELRKTIPPGKGLGGGSSDAAAALAGLKDLWRVGVEDRELSDLAAQLGSDVPLFMGPPAARMTGRGEVLQPLDIHPFAAGLFLPDIVCHTPKVYQAFDELTGKQESPPPAPGRIDPSMLASKPPSQWRHLLVNQLTESAVKVCPGLGELLRELQNALPCPVHMSGSGSALFILCDDAAELSAMLSRLPDRLQRLCCAVINNPF
jgi:4-diphosphocytidyl-2-C-methyl-D-erythritol kinase